MAVTDESVEEIEEAEAETPELEGCTIWSDEFNSTELDMDLWNMEPRESGWTNEELQEYTTSTDNIYIEDGKLF